MEYIKQMLGNSIIEYVAVICGLLNVYLIIRRSLWNFFFGFIMVVLYVKIFFDYQLYSDSLLQVFFFITQIYGLYYWIKHKAPDGKVVVLPIRKQRFLVAILMTMILWFILSIVMQQYTDATHPIWDGSIAAFSVTAQILLMRRNIESWYLWITVDLLAIGLFSVKGLYPTAGLYTIFLALAVIGLLQWRRTLRD